MFKLLSVMAASALLAAPAWAAPVIGQAAPDFEATDTKGNPVKLSDLKGKTVVLEWTNAECPFVVKHYDSGNMQQSQRTAKAAGATWLTINSSAVGKQGHVDEDKANAIVTKSNAAPDHVILDPEGSIGKLYDAKATPHMFVIDKDGILTYAGAIDSKPTADQADIASSINYVTTAVTALAEGSPIEVTSTQAYGCNVKY